VLIAFGGLPGTGKTTLARTVASRYAAVYLRIDTIEQAIQDSDVLRANIGAAGYVTAYRVAADNLRVGRSVVGDAVNPLTVTRDSWAEVARLANVSLVEVEVICSDVQEHKGRVESRSSDIVANTNGIFCSSRSTLDTKNNEHRSRVLGINGTESCLKGSPQNTEHSQSNTYTFFTCFRVYWGEKCGSDPTLEEIPMKSITRFVTAVVAVMLTVAILCPAQDAKSKDLGKGSAFNGKKLEMKDNGEVAYLLSFTAGKEFEATTDGLKNTDVHLFVYDSSGAEVAKDDSPGPKCSVKVTPEKDGQYKFVIKNAGGANTVSFKVKVAK
jgi:predicted kinase